MATLPQYYLGEKRKKKTIQARLVIYWCLGFPYYYFESRAWMMLIERGYTLLGGGFDFPLVGPAKIQALPVHCAGGHCPPRLKFSL